MYPVLLCVCVCVHVCACVHVCVRAHGGMCKMFNIYF